MRTALLVITLAAALPAALPAQDKEVIRLPGSLEALPFSSAVRVGEIIYLSGQIGVLPGTMQLVPGGIGPQTRQAMENIAAVLEYAGSAMDRVIKCTVFLSDIADYPAMNEVYRSFFPGHPPARSALAASGLALGAKVEIECIALSGR